MQRSPEPIAPDPFGPYEVYERLGVGGMATVDRAKKRGEAGVERSVALKRVVSDLSEDPTFVESFIREAKLSSLLIHPNIAQIYDFGRIHETYFIAMELVPGFDLRELLRYANRANEAIPHAVVLSILGEMCDALEYAHTRVDERGQPLRIVHRDLSPSNIIVAHTGHTKVIDFGIAKANRQTKGKLGYMSPEAARGIRTGPVTDVFSMGVVAWELVTASPLFSARTDSETMRKLREAAVPPPSTLNPACPHELDRLILSALERDSTRRLASAGQFRRGLDQIAARAGLKTGSRVVGEWIRPLLQPEASSMPHPASPGQVALRRSREAIQLAAEIWGEDAAARRIAAGSSPGALPSTATPVPQLTPQLTPPTRRSSAHIVEHYIPGYLPAGTQQSTPEVVAAAPPRRSRKPIYLVIALAAIAAALLVVLLAS
ncbi:MAG: serine/threonine-protein kinase [Kofleriaceae bacterium]